MKTLIVDDDFTCRVALLEMLKGYGVTHVARNGLEAINLIRESFKEKAPFDLICLDIMMPELSGQEVLKQIRAMEDVEQVSKERRSKILMVTALNDMKNVMTAYNQLCDDYIVKPIDKEKVLLKLAQLRLIS